MRRAARSLRAGIVFVLVSTASLVAPAASPAAPVAEAAGPQQVLAFANVVGGLFQRQRVYRNAAEVQEEIRSYYDELLDTARAALRDRELSKLDNQVAAYVRLVASLEAEKTAALQLLEDDKRGAHQAFRSNLNRQLPTMLLSIPAARDMAQVLRGDLAEIRDVLNATRDAIAGGRPDALVDIARRRAALDRYAAIVGAIGGKPGRDIANAVGALGAGLQRVEAATDAATEDVENDLADAEQQIATALDRLDEQLATEVRPASVSLFGGLGNVRIPGEFALYAALAEALSAPGSRTHGLTRDAMRDRVRAFLVEQRGEGIAALRDCLVASAAQLRARLGGDEAPEGTAAALLLTADLRSCDPDVVRAVLAAAAEFEPTTTTSEPATDTAEPDATPGDRIRGGSVHQITTASTGMQIGNGGTLCLEYFETRPDQLPLSLVACTTSPVFDIVYDLAAGTVAGTVELDLACPGADRCWQDDSTTGSVRGTFGPFQFGRQPEQAPADFPFPAHHYYGGQLDWWAGGTIELTVAISGDHVVGEQVLSGSASITITGWMEASLWPPVQRPNELPSDWMTDFKVILDFPQDVNPNWYLYAGFSAPVPESAIAVPPWR